MKRIDTVNAVPDMFGPGKSGFRNGNKAQGIPATELNAPWFNNLQEEVANVIEAADIELDGNKRTQLLEALQTLFSNPLPDGTATGQVPIWNPATGEWEPGFVSGVPIGTFSKTGATQADKGYINISYDQLTFWPVAGNIGDGSDAIGDLVTKCWVGSAANATAPYFFRCNADGTVRSDTGAYFAIPYG